MYLTLGVNTQANCRWLYLFMYLRHVSIRLSLWRQSRGEEHHSSRSRKALQNTCGESQGTKKYATRQAGKLFGLLAARATKYLNAGVISIFESGLLLYGFSTPACAHVLLYVCAVSSCTLNMHSRCDLSLSWVVVYSDDVKSKKKINRIYNF